MFGLTAARVPPLDMPGHGRTDGGGHLRMSSRALACVAVPIAPAHRSSADPAARQSPARSGTTLCPRPAIHGRSRKHACCTRRVACKLPSTWHANASGTAADGGASPRRRERVEGPARPASAPRQPACAQRRGRRRPGRWARPAPATALGRGPCWRASGFRLVRRILFACQIVPSRQETAYWPPDSARKVSSSTSESGSGSG
jgi:hypothetical protein